MFETIKFRMYIAKTQAELKAQYSDQDFVNRVCQLPENIEHLRDVREHAYYGRDRTAPVINVCHVLCEGMNSKSLSEDDREVCASLLAQRLQMVASDPHFKLRHFLIFSDLEEKIADWAATNDKTL